MTSNAHIGDLTPQARNARKHNARNIGMIARSMQEVGAARSIVINEDGVILAGNGTVEAAAQAGITRVVVVDADGETIVAVRRVGLSDEQQARLAIYDNRTADLAAWDSANLAEYAAALDLSDMFTESELARELGGGADPDTDKVGYSVIVQFATLEAVAEFEDVTGLALERGGANLGRVTFGGE